MKEITNESLFEMVSYGQPTISPKKDRIVYVKTCLDKEKDSYVSSVYAYHIETKEVHQWICEGTFNGGLKFSPDGTRLAFISNRHELNQLYVLSLSGGEAIQVTKLEKGISTYEWLPSGEGWIVQAPKGSQEAFKENEAKGYDELHYRHDLGGYITPNQFEQLYLVKETSEPVLLTHEPVDYSLVDVHENSKHVLFLKKINESELNHQEGLYELNLENQEVHYLSAFAKEGSIGNAWYQPNGKMIVMIGTTKPLERVNQPELFLFDTTTNEVKKGFHEDCHLGDCSVGDFKLRSNGKTGMFSHDGKGFYFRVAHKGRVALYGLSLESGQAKAIIAFDGCVGDFDVYQNVLVYVKQTPNQPSDIILHAGSQDGVQITHDNDVFVSKHTFGKYEEIELETHDHKTMHGFIVYPTNFDRDKKYPIIYNIHGGPAAMHGLTFFHEVQVMANQGYAVLLVNPRGSYGYGEAHMRGILGDYGGHDYLDLMDGMDYVLNQYSWLDASRQYVTGGSYGGYMTNWIVTHTNRFKAAATQRSISNWISFWGTSDIGYFFVDWQFQGADVKDQFDMMWERSPLAHIKNATTPTLVIHSENDFRCPIEQGEQMFTGLKFQGVDTRLVRFPKSTHELSRSGIPSLRLKRLDEIMGWFKRYE